MRADRLVAALLLLQARGRVTAAELADELEVSVATARRDLEALSAAGIPVYPQAGRGGGWSLVGGARTDLSGLSAAEAQALFLLVGPAAAVSGAAKAALRKLVQALPQTFRSDAEAASAATMIDPARWGEPDRRRPEIVDLLQNAVVRRRKIRLAYVGRTRERTERLVDPWGLVDKDDIWYLVAGTDRGQRTFRVDRILGAEPTELPAERPRGLHTRNSMGAGRRRGRAAALTHLGDRAHRVEVRLGAAKAVRAALPSRRRVRRRAHPGPPCRAHAAGHRPSPGGLGYRNRGRRTAIGPDRAGEDRRRADQPLRQHGSRVRSGPRRRSVGE
jgi:predicted DNA-binding transcriptional regulator YafY